MSAIGPGDFVECVDQRGHPELVKKGQPYLVEAVGESCGVPAIQLKGVVHPTHGFRWVRADCFRPIYRPRSSLIEALKQPAPAEPKRVTV